jgi:hypothetical protein
MTRRRGPGPGQVVQLAEEVKYQWHDESQWAKGVRNAIAWVMDEGEQHPIKRRRSSNLPDMRLIAEAAKLARDDTVNDPQFDANYYTGVNECLEWITGDNDTRPQQFQHPS